VTLRVFGEYSLKVTDAVPLVTNLTGTVDVTNNDAITNWVGAQLLKVMRTEVTRQILGNGWPVLSLSAYTPDIEQTVIDGGNEILKAYGLAIVRMGNFDVNLAEQDEATLKSLAKDTAYSKLAGGFQQYAAGEALLGAGEGMSKGGAAAGGAILATGMGVGQQAVGWCGPAAAGPGPAAGPAGCRCWRPVGPAHPGGGPGPGRVSVVLGPEPGWRPVLLLVRRPPHTGRHPLLAMWRRASARSPFLHPVRDRRSAAACGRA